MGIERHRPLSCQTIRLSISITQHHYACGELFDERYPVWAEIAVISSRQDVLNALIGPSSDL